MTCEKIDSWHPVSGTLDNPRNAKDPEEEERRVWGNVIIAEHGSALVSTWVPSEKAAGQFLLKDNPFQLVTPPDSKIRVIAAPVEEIYSNGSVQLRAYTANFTIIPAPQERVENGCETAARAQCSTTKPTRAPPRPIKVVAGLVERRLPAFRNLQFDGLPGWEWDLI